MSINFEEENLPITPCFEEQEAAFLSCSES